jgi:hypothetical protein
VAEGGHDERTIAQAELQALDTTGPPTTPDSLRELLGTLQAEYRDMAEVLAAAADPADKAALLSSLACGPTRCRPPTGRESRWPRTVRA